MSEQVQRQGRETKGLTEETVLTINKKSLFSYPASMYEILSKAGQKSGQLIDNVLKNIQRSYNKPFSELLIRYKHDKFFAKNVDETIKSMLKSHGVDITKLPAKGEGIGEIFLKYGALKEASKKEMMKKLSPALTTPLAMILSFINAIGETATSTLMPQASYAMYNMHYSLYPLQSLFSRLREKEMNDRNLLAHHLLLQQMQGNQ